MVIKSAEIALLNRHLMWLFHLYLLYYNFIGQDGAELRSGKADGRFAKPPRTNNMPVVAEILINHQSPSAPLVW